MEGGGTREGNFTALFEIELLKAMLNVVSSSVTTNRGEGHRVSAQRRKAEKSLFRALE